MILLFGGTAIAGPGQFEADCRALTAGSHRLTGTPEYGRAAAYVEERLRRLGADRVIVQEFPAVQTTVKQCRLVMAADTAATRAARTVALFPVRNNGIIPPVTPPEGIGGPLYHAGGGEAVDFKDRPVTGCIVVLDYNGGRNWLRAFRLGARAVIWVKSGPARAWNPHYVDANVNLPRYYYPGPAADLPDGALATITSQVVWEPVVGRNVFAFFKGTAPRFHLDQDELIIVSAHLDTYGEVPALCPGARGAANCAGLLQLAESLKRRPARRHMLVAFFDGQARGHAGANAFYLALEKDEAKARAGRRMGYQKKELAFIGKVEKALTLDSPVGLEPAVERDLFRRLKLKAEERAYACKDRLLELRTMALDSTGREAEILELERQIQQVETEKTRWNDVRRALAKKVFTPETGPPLAELCDEIRQDIRQREEELVREGRMLKGDSLLAELTDSLWIGLHVSLLVGDNSPRWGITIGGDSRFHAPNDLAALYGKVQNSLLAAAQELASSGRSLAGFEAASVDGSLGPARRLLAVPFLTHAGEIAGNLGYFNLVVGTAQENYGREGTPDDTYQNLDRERMEQQLTEAGLLLTAAAGQEGLSLLHSILARRRYFLTTFESDLVQGPRAMSTSRGSNMPNVSLPGAILQYTMFKWPELEYNGRSKPYAYDDFQVISTNANGSYGIGPVWSSGQARGFTVRFDGQGEVSQASSGDSDPIVHYRQNLYRCRQGFAVLPPHLRYQTTEVFDAKTNSRLVSDKSSFKTIDGIVHWFSEEKVHQIKLFGKQSVVLLANGADTLEGQGKTGGPPVGAGRAIDRGWEPPNSARQSAADLWRLNESRLKLLRDKGVLNHSLEELHGRSEDLLTTAKRTASFALSEAWAASAFMIERTVYSKTRYTLDDLVHAVLVLLALSVPFAFFLERLLVGSTVISRQIGWFALFFALVFLFLFYSHPAFALSTAPIVIFLGFAVIVLSCMVIVILMRKFEFELKRLQGLTSTVHAADVSRFGTIMAAMSMGISTMRRRPLRTGLTAVTIILLTFTILCFASFGTRTGIIKMFLREPPGYTGLLVHNVYWQELNEDILDVIGLRWPGTAVCPRYWIAPKTEEAEGLLVSRTDGTKPTTLSGVVGINPQELAFRPDLAALLGAPAGPTVWMTRAVAGRLRVQPGDTVLVAGQRLTVGRLLAPEQVIQVKDLDNSDILPVDFVEIKKTTGAQGEIEVSDLEFDEGLLGLQENANWTTLSTDITVLVTAPAAKKMGAALHSIALYTATTQEAGSMAEELGRMVLLPVYATRYDGVYTHVLGPVLKASGAKDLLFPILLGGLVIFGTMLGSVTDREKEIYSFSALGLAPPHVAGLFFAEAIVYSIIGGMGGYLTAQGVMKLFGYLAGFGLVKVPEMNYSSSNAVVTILLVMGTVLVSTIYPAIKASRSANPGVLRYWRLPAPTGDTFNITFPFTVSEYDITGVVSFLKEHFDAYSDTGLGVFMAQETRILHTAETGLGLHAYLALAPFDLGVTEQFELRPSPSEIAGIDEVKINIYRTSGQPKDWRRLNKILFDDLRKQFLIWRSLPPETMEKYRQDTLAFIGGNKKEHYGG